MDFSNAVAHGGLSAKGTATRHGSKWTPRVGTAASRTTLSDADLAVSFEVTFPEASGNFQLFGLLTTFGVGTVDAARDTVIVSGVTGADEGLVNVTYTRSATLYNAAPQWVNSTAAIRLSTAGVWEIVLAGVAQFNGTNSYLLPVLMGANWSDAGAAGTGGVPLVSALGDGDLPVASIDLSAGVDAEGSAFASLESLRGFEVVVTAGSGMLSLDSSGHKPVPISLGGRFLLVLPAAVPAGLLPYLIFAASEPGTVIQVTVLGKST